jgi:hypothetical protein
LTDPGEIEVANADTFSRKSYAFGDQGSSDKEVSGGFQRPLFQ